MKKRKGIKKLIKRFKIIMKRFLTDLMKIPLLINKIQKKFLNPVWLRSSFTSRTLNNLTSRCKRSNQMDKTRV